MEERQLVLVVEVGSEQEATELLAAAASALPEGRVKRTSTEPFPPDETLVRQVEKLQGKS